MMLTQLSGQIEKITYTNEENGFTIALVKVEAQKDPVTVVGNLMAPTPGEILEIFWKCRVIGPIIQNLANSSRSSNLRPKFRPRYPA